MKLTSTEQRTILFPTRIVKTEGAVTNPEVMLLERSPVTTMKEATVTKMEKTGAENPSILLDFGKEIHGSLRIVVAKLCRGKSNLKMHLTFGESVSEALSRVGEKGATNDHSPRDFDILISNLSNVEYGSTGFRFVRVELIEEGSVELRSLVAVSKTANIEKRGYFRTNDELFNRIIDTAAYTCYLNLQDGVIWDGIKRDRLVWAGDLNSEILTLLYLYGPVEHIGNSLEHLRLATAEHRWMNTIPSYSAWWAINVILYYRMSGDREFLNENIDRINSILSDYALCISEDGTVDFDRLGDPAAHMYYYFDWPTRDTDDAEVGTMLLIYYFAQRVIEAEVDGIDSKVAEQLAERVSRYLDAPTLMKQTLAFQSICGGMRGDTLARLEEGGARGFSTFMSYFLLKGLTAAGSTRALELAKDYYGGMLSRGATTFWEDFDMDWLEGSGRIDEIPKEGEKDLHADYGKYCYKNLRHSFCHGWSSGVVGWAFEDVLGLRLLDNAFKRISVKPNLMGLEWIEAKIPAPQGDILIRAEAGKAPIVELPAGIELV
ncbi:MAG: hypothetical protein IJW16_08195 [Clostridia bacterium]|nr:hypothetical protein [Clostridia bacterium]